MAGRLSKGAVVVSGGAVSATSRRENVPAPRDSVQQLAAEHLAGRREVGQLPVYVRHQIDGQQRQRGTQPPDPPSRARPACPWCRVDEVQDRVGGRDGAQQPQIGGCPALHGGHHRQLAQLPPGRGASEVEGEGEAVGHRGHPQVLLQRLEHPGQRLGDRAGAQQARFGQRPGRHRGDGPGLEQPQLPVRIEAELHVLGAAERPLGLLGQVHQPHSPPVGKEPVASCFGRVGTHQAGEAGELIAHPLGTAVDELMRSAGHRADEDPVSATLDGVGAEHHAADGGLEHRLHQHRHSIIVWGPLRRAQRPDSPSGVKDDLHRDGELLPAPHIQHRLEPPRHRGVLGVLVRGGGPHDQRPFLGAGQRPPRGAHRVLPGSRPGRPVGRHQYEPWKRRQPRHSGTGRIGGLRAGGG
jgi:hypothetical protein